MAGIVSKMRRNSFSLRRRLSFCGSLIIDVREQAVPAGNAAAFVLERGDVGVHPAIDAIGAHHSNIRFQRSSGCHTLEPLAVDDLLIVRVNERETVEPLYLSFARVVEEALIRVLLLACRINDQDHPGNAVNELPKLMCVLTQHPLVPFVLNRNRRQMRDLLDEYLILPGWSARLAPVNRERAQYQAVRSLYRGGPARFQAVRQRGRAPSIQ